MELETLKIDIKIHLKIGFIYFSKFWASAIIVFDQEQDKSLCLYINYQRREILTIKNRYPLILIGEILD